MPSFKLLSETEPPRPKVADRPSAGPVYTLASCKEVPSLSGVDTLYHLFEASVEKYGERPCLGSRTSSRPYTFITYKQVADSVNTMASAFAKLGISSGDKVGVYAVNCPEWMISMQAMNRIGAICVPIYDTLAENAIEFIINRAGVKLVLCSATKLPPLAKVLPHFASTTTSGVIYWGAISAIDTKAFEDAKVPTVAWEEALKIGTENPVFPTPPSPSDPATIMFTSGATGDPKGVVLTHKAVIACIAGVKEYMRLAEESLGPEDVFLSYLPLAHIMDRAVEEFMLHVGGSIGYWQGDIKKIMDDIEALKPTLFAGVPRVFDRVYNGVVEKVKKAGGISALIYKWMYDRKLHFMKQGSKAVEASMLADALVFNKIKMKLGGCVRVILSGGAPLAPHVEEFLRVAMCAPVVQGYGLTETCAASFISQIDNMAQAGTVGPPMPGTQLRLEAVEEMGYDPMGTPPRGEVCLRGPSLFTEYWHMPELTAESLDSEGFFHTGDVGEIVGDGALKIIDRKKNMFKLAQGEYIAVEKLENVLKQCEAVEQIWVYGSSFESQLVAVVVPREDWLHNAGGDNNNDSEALCADPKIVKEMLTLLAATGKAGKLKGFELVKAVHLTPHQFTVENELLTPSYKLKRGPLQKKYQAQIDAMYAELKAKSGGGE